MTSTQRVILLLAISATLGRRAATQTPTAVQHAQHLIEVMGMRAVFRSAESTYVTSLVRLHPNLSRYSDVLEAWQLEVFTWDSVGVGISRRLAKELSIPELDSLTEFYRSPLGQKWRRVAAILDRAVVENQAQLVHDHYPELRARLQRRAQELHQGDPLASD